MGVLVGTPPGELMGFRNRLNVLVNWAWNYVTYDRGSRLLAEADRELQ